LLLGHDAAPHPLLFPVPALPPLPPPPLPPLLLMPPLLVPAVVLLIPADAPPSELPVPAVAGLPPLLVPALLVTLPPVEGVPLIEMVPAEAPATGVVLVPALPPTPSVGGSSAEQARLQTPEKIPAHAKRVA
jgi:hypothetical protein